MSSITTSTGQVKQPSGSQAAPRRRLRDLITLPGESGLDLRNTWQIVAGAILVPLGFAAIILGWAGAAHGRVEQQQLPYIISGGLLGLAAVVLGGFFFWAHWLYRIYDQADLHNQAMMREQAEFHRALLQAVGHGGALPTTAGTTTTVADASAEFVATPSGSNYHLRDCPIVAKHSSLRSLSAADVDGMKPCRICEPQA